MKDLAFDFTTRELIMKGQLNDGSQDLTTTDNPSVQNGGILLISRCDRLSNPMLGVGLDVQEMNSSGVNMAFEVNRWQAECLNDGATLAKGEVTFKAAKEADLKIEISYL